MAKNIIMTMRNFNFSDIVEKKNIPDVNPFATSDFGLNPYNVLMHNSPSYLSEHGLNNAPEFPYDDQELLTAYMNWIYESVVKVHQNITAANEPDYTITFESGECWSCIAELDKLMDTVLPEMDNIYICLNTGLSSLISHYLIDYEGFTQVNDQVILDHADNIVTTIVNHADACSDWLSESTEVDNTWRSERTAVASAFPNVSFIEFADIYDLTPITSHSMYSDLIALF